jgi:hypothetical protein
MRQRPVPQSVVAAAEDIEYLMERGKDFIRNHTYFGIADAGMRQDYLHMYLANAVRLITKEA